MDAKSEITREQFITNQRKYCKKNNAPFFMPANGICWHCHQDIVSALIAKGHTGLDELVTGCPLCCWSYCE